MIMTGISGKNKNSEKIIVLFDSSISEIETLACCGVEIVIAFPPSSAIYSPEKNTLPDAVVSIFIDDSWCSA